MRPGPTHGLWWAAPAGSMLLVLPIALWLSWSTSDLSFRLLYRSPKVLQEEEVLLFAAGALALLLGVVVVLAAFPGQWKQGWPHLDDRQLDLIGRASTVCWWLTLVGYGAFGLAGLARGASPGLLLQTLTSQENYGGRLKELFAPVTGITTLTQVGIAYVVLAMLLWSAGRREGLVLRLSVITALALVRSFFLTERLALIEVLVPLVLLLAVARQRQGDLRASLSPVLALPGLVVLFGVFEYSRSWTYFRSRTTATYPEFVLDRLAGYYATAFNNGAAQLVDGRYEGRLPYGTIEAFWTAPGVAQLELYERLSGRNAAEVYQEVLRRQANPEFNNPCGLCTPFVDFGTAGGLVVLLLLGVLAGAAWVGFRDGRPLGLLFYPMIFLGLLELPRFLYIAQGRVVPAVVALGTVALLLHRLPSSAPVPGRQPPPVLRR